MSFSLEEPTAADRSANHPLGRHRWRMCVRVCLFAVGQHHLLASRLKQARLE
jgi:hypothetical protein